MYTRHRRIPPSDRTCLYILIVSTSMTCSFNPSCFDGKILLWSCDRHSEGGNKKLVIRMSTSTCSSELVLYIIINQVSTAHSTFDMPDLFSTPAEHAFEHAELEDVQPEAGPSSMGDAVGDMTIEEAFEVEDTVKRIIAGGYKTVCVS